MTKQKENKENRKKLVFKGLLTLFEGITISYMIRLIDFIINLISNFFF